MRVLLSPGAEALARGVETAEEMAGSEVEVARLAQLGARNLRRPLSRAEINVVRSALRGAHPLDGQLAGRPAVADDELLIGYVCAGTMAPSGGGPVQPAVEVRSVVVTDHVNLTWRSPLTGPNDERFGPRFPVVAEVYRPETVRAAPAQAPLLGVVAGVRDDRRLTAFEAEVVVRHGIRVVSSELVAVSILAAHMGFKVAAVVVVDGVSEIPEGACGTDGAGKGLERSG
jgi:hypothetical protein